MAHSTLHRHRRPETGFTLIELMIVVAIIGILASVAYPSYTAYIRRGNLQEALSNLADLRIQFEQYYQDNKAYGPGANTFCGTSTSDTPATVDHKYFDYTCATAGTGQTFLITATGKASTTAAGYTYTMDDQGNKKTTSFDSTAVDLSCWAVKSTSDCS